MVNTKFRSFDVNLLTSYMKFDNPSIVCAHFYCARNSRRNVTPCQASSSALSKKNIDKYSGGGYFYIYKRA